MKPRLAVLVSGGGRSLRNILERERDGRLATETALVVASREGIGALDRAKEFDVPSRVLPGPLIAQALDEAKIDWVVMAGYLKRWDIPDRFAGRAINIHPALLPLFGGRGCYGRFVHEAVKRSGMRVSGCTVHFVTAEYDAGPIIDQRAVHLDPSDTPEQIARRVFVEELELLPRAISDLAEGRVRFDRATGSAVWTQERDRLLPGTRPSGQAPTGRGEIPPPAG